MAKNICRRACVAAALGFLLSAGAACAQMFETGPASVTRMWLTDRDDNAMHLPSGVGCPAVISTLHRSKLETSDVSPFNGSCRYDFDGGNIEILFQLFPGALKIDMFELFQMAARSAEKDAQPLPADQGAFESDLPWKHALYTLHDTGRLGLWGVKLTTWNVSIKASFDARNTETVLSALKAFSAPLKQADSAQAAACTGLKTAQMTGQRLDIDKNEAAGLKVLASAGLTGSWMVQPEKAPAAAKAAAGPNWCVANMLSAHTADGKALSIIHYRHPPENAGAVDRVVGSDGSFAVMVARDALMGGADPAQALHYVFVEDADLYWLVGFYAGRPSLAELMRYVHMPNVTAYASISRKDGSVFMYGPACPRPVINNGVFPARASEDCKQPAGEVPKPG